MHLDSSEYFTKVVRMNHKRRVMSDRANATSTYGSLSVLSRGSQTVRSATDARNQLTLCLSGVRLWTMWAWMFLARCRDSTQSPCPHACCAHRHAMATTERGSLAAAAAGGSACVICGAVTQALPSATEPSASGRLLRSGQLTELLERRRALRVLRRLGRCLALIEVDPRTRRADRPGPEVLGESAQNRGVSDADLSTVVIRSRLTAVRWTSADALRRRV